MSKVVVVRRSGAVPTEKFTRDEYRMLLEFGLRSLSAKKSTSAAIKMYLPGGTIGMKTNCLTRKLNSTPVALTDTIGDFLEEAGFEANDIVVWERTARELQLAGYKLNASSFGRRCLGTDARHLGYASGFYSSGEVSSLVSSILTDIVNYNINLPVLKDHSIAGLSGGLKNMLGAINNPNKYHDHNCDPFVAHICNLDPIKTKNRLTIMDAVKVQYDKGPGFSRESLAYYHGLILSDDPVAADRVGLEILEHLRRTNGCPPLDKVGRPAKYLKSAEQLGLGTADMQRIDLQVLLVDETGRSQTGGLF